MSTFFGKYPPFKTDANGNILVSLSGGASAAFNSITSGTNTTAAMVIGSGASLTNNGPALAQKAVVANTGSAYTIDPANGTQFDLTMNSATPTLTLAAPTAGESQTLYVTLIQDATTSRVPSIANATSGTGYSLAVAPTGNTYLRFVTDGTTWYWYQDGVIANQNNLAVNLALQCPKYSAALAAVRSGSGGKTAKILVLGDSTSIGKGSAPSGDRVIGSWPSILQRCFTKAGINSTRSSFFGLGDGTTPSYDPRITVGSSWFAGGNNSMGGPYYEAGTNTNALSFTPTDNTDTCNVYYVVRSGGGTLSVDIDGSGTVTQSSNGSSAVAKKTITGTLGLHTYNVKWSSGGTVQIIGMEAYNSTISQLEVLNPGWSGALTSDVSNTTNTYSSLNVAKFIAPDLTILATVINDWVNLVDLTTYKANVQKVITAAKLSGDCAIFISVPSNTNQQTTANQLIYVDALRTIAANSNILLIDVYSRFVSYAVSSVVTAAGLYSDNLHENGPGYEVAGQLAFDVIGNIGEGAGYTMGGYPLFVQTVANNTYSYVQYAGCAGTILGVAELARALTTAGTFSININGVAVTGLSAVVPTTAGSYTAATAANTFKRGDKITIVYSSTSLVLDHSLLLDYVQII